jgi:regulator of PEP synthase PpsR (kinase-PPPase family)
MNKRTVFIISDHTGITAQTLARTLLSQFEGVAFESVLLPFTDSEAKVRAAREHIDTARARDGVRPIVLSTLTDSRLRALLRESDALVLDLFEAFIGALEEEFARASTPVVGKTHGLADREAGRRRMQAVKFALSCDDGVNEKAYADADVILLGVSRTGKTPASLYLAMQWGLKAANYPLTEEDLRQGALPAALRPHSDRLVGLAMEPGVLQRMREERRPDSAYSALGQCQWEMRASEDLFRAEGIPVVDATHRSVEEVASKVRQLLHRSPAA